MPRTRKPSSSSVSHEQTLRDAHVGAQLGVVGVAQAGEARAELVGVRPGEHVHAGQVDVVLDQHQPAGTDVDAQRAGRVRQHQELRAGRLERADGHPDLVQVPALVEMGAALEGDHGHAADLARNGSAGVALHPGDREAGQVGVRDHGGVLDGVGHLAEARAEHDSDARRQAGALDDHVRCLAPAHESRLKDRGSNSPSVVV